MKENNNRKGLTLSLFLFFSLILTPLFVSGALTDNIVGYYKFDETSGTSALDSVTSVNAELLNGQGFTSAGKINYSTLGDGSNDFVNTTQRYSSAFESSSAFTFNAWVQNSDIGSNPNDYIFSKYTAGNYIGVFYLGGLPRLYIEVVDNINRGYWSDYSGVINNNTRFYMITAVYNGSASNNAGRLKLYVDGVQRTLTYEGTIPSTSSSNTAPLYIGAQTGSGSSPNKGKIDEVGIWNRSLTDGEITALYNNTAGLQYPFSTTPPAVDPIPVFINQTPSDISISNVVGNPAVIIYNNTLTNFTGAYLNYSMNGTNIYVNGTSYNNFNSSYRNSSGQLLTFVLVDNKVYPGVYNIDEQTMEDTPHSNFSVSNSNNYYMVNLLGINASKQYSFLEAYVSASGNGRVYYCNSSYTSGNIKSNNNCVLFGVFDTTTFNHTHNNSKHNVFSMPLINGTLGGVVVTSNSSFGFTREAGTIYLGYVNITSRSNSLRVSNNNGNSWTNLGNSYTMDLHVHQFDVNDGIVYKACVYNTSNTYCSTSRVDNYNITYLPPTSVTVILNDDSFYYGDTLVVTRTNSTGFNDTIAYYSYYIYDSNFNLYKTINSTTNLSSVSYTLSNMSPSYYYVVVNATETLSGLTSSSISDYFILGSEYTGVCNETITVNSTGVPILFNWTTDALSGNVEIYRVADLISYFVTNTTGYTVINNTIHGNYTLYMNQSIYKDLNCYLDLCVNSWVSTTGDCINGFQDVNYTDSNNCAEEYDKPSDYTTTCTVSASTFNVFFLIIILGLVLLLIGLIWKNPIFLMFSGLLLFLCGVMMLIEPITNITETMNLIVGVSLFGFGAWLWVTSTLGMIEGESKDEEDW